MAIILNDLTTVANYLTSDYPRVGPWTPTNAVEDRLLESGYLVVEEDGRYYGILTPADILESPRKLVIDCLHSLPTLSPDISLSEAVGIMCKTRRFVLPVFRDTTFLGVLCSCNLFDALFQETSLLQHKPMEKTNRVLDLRQSVASQEARYDATLTALEMKEVAIESALLGIAMADLDGRLTYVNPAFVAMWRLPDRKAALGKPAVSFWVSPAEAENVIHHLHLKGWFEGELEALREDGSTFPVQITAAMIQRGGQAIGMTASFLDLTEKYALEEANRTYLERLRTALRHSPLVIFTQDRDLRYTWLSENALGLDPHHAIGTSEEDLHTPEDAAKLRAIKQRILQTGNPERHTLSLTIRGELRWYDASYEPLRDKSGTIIGLIGTAVDITESRKKEEALRQAEKLATLGTLVTGIAHEVNNPNAAILGHAQNLEKIWQYLEPVLDEIAKKDSSLHIGALSYGEIQEEVPKMLREIQGSSMRIEAIVKKLRDYAMPSSGKKEWINLNEIVYGAFQLVRKNLLRATDHFALELEDSLPLLQGDRVALEQMTLNLLLNACQALTDRSQALTVFTRQDPQKSSLLLIVADEGRGIPQESLPRIFDPFFTTRREEGGTGLGLAIVASIVKEHGGEISVKSEVGKGTTVTVRLPYEGKV